MLSPKLLIGCVVLFASGASIGRSSFSETETGFASTVANQTVPNQVVVSQTVVTQDLMPRTTPRIELTGKWESNVFGHQTLTTRPDGTATISMTLTALAIPIYGRKVELDLEWTLNGAYLTQRIVGGSPERSVEKLIRKYGDTHEYLVVEHDANYLLVRDTTGGSDPVRWTAVEHDR